MHSNMHCGVLLALQDCVWIVHPVLTMCKFAVTTESNPKAQNKEVKYEIDFSPEKPEL